MFLQSNSFNLIIQEYTFFLKQIKLYAIVRYLYCINPCNEGAFTVIILFKTFHVFLRVTHVFSQQFHFELKINWVLNVSGIQVIPRALIFLVFSKFDQALVTALGSLKSSYLTDIQTSCIFIGQLRSTECLVLNAILGEIQLILITTIRECTN